jgi:phosphoglycerate dehydrogenase-like enzyme
MGFKLVILHDRHVTDEWVDRIKAVAPGCEVCVARTHEEGMREIVDADAAYGNVVPEIFGKAKKLRWIQAPAAAPPVGYYHKGLIESDVVVTNLRGIFNEHLATHIMAFVLAFARGLHDYIPQQVQREWMPVDSFIHLPEATVLIVGIGGSGAETARLCATFGMTVLGLDPRVMDPPPGVSELHRPDALHDLLPRADFVIMTVPQTPQTVRMMTMREFKLMKSTAYLINVGRGGTVVLDDLVHAIRSGEMAGAGLDVFETEPLPRDHPLWTIPGVLITPHLAGAGPYVQDRRFEVFLDNCRRFADGQPLRNIVDKANWF